MQQFVRDEALIKRKDTILFKDNSGPHIVPLMNDLKELGYETLTRPVYSPTGYGSGISTTSCKENSSTFKQPPKNAFKNLPLAELLNSMLLE